MEPAVLSGAGPDVFVNANTISRWVLSQPTESQLEIAQALFEKLLEDASQARQSSGNGHACVKLCSFIQQCAKSKNEILKHWAFTEPLSIRLFHFYLEWCEHDPHRALRLVLDILVVSTTENPSPEVGREIREHILDTVVSIVARVSTTQLTKSGLQCLDHLLTKRSLNLDDVARKYREIQPSVAGLPSLSLWRSFAFDLFTWMKLSYVSPLAGKCLVHVIRGLDYAASNNATTETDGFTMEVCQKWLQDALMQDPNILDDIKNYVLVPIFKSDRDRSLSLRLLEAFNGQELTDQTLLLQLATLELGKKSGLVEEPSNWSEPSTSSLVALPETILNKFLEYPSLSVRSSAFSLLVSSQATTKPFSDVAFALLKKHLTTYHADYDAKLRNEMLGLTKYLIRRLKNIISVAERSLSGPANQNVQQPARKRFGPEAAYKGDDEANEVLGRHVAFLSWYMEFLNSELIPTASYQRHITALKAILMALKVGKHAGAADDAIDMEIVALISSDFTWMRVLLDLMMDPFDDVRESASVLLGLFPHEVVKAPAGPDSGSKTLLESLRDFCLRAQALADRTGRADHGDGAARAQGLLCKWLTTKELQMNLVSNIIQGLEDKISKAEVDLGHAAIENPVHADFAALSYAWPVLAKTTYSDSQLEGIQEIHRRVFACSGRIWLAVKHVLCDDSPEGHLPEELEEVEGLDTKDLLSYSFRAIHESSNLLRLMVGTLRLTPAPGVPFPPPEVFKSVGSLTFEQLACLRHRGAFSTVSLTFTTCCQLTQNLLVVFPEVAASENLLRGWYQGAIDCIMTQASTTRRSAGIPSLIAAVLSANAESPSFEEVFHTLEEIGKKDVRMSETDGSNLPQVHALNSLREIFRSSLSSKKAESFLATTLHLAANSLKSEVWAIRNCGLLLLRSLIDCLLGTGESKATIESGWDGVSIRISYSKYPTLPGVILGLLQSAGEVLGEASHTAAAEAVFPALDIIRRAGPPEENRAELWKHIEGYLGSRIWHVREIAAKTLCSFLLQEDWIAGIERLLENSENDANRLHGVLLTTRFVLERKANLGGDIKLDSARVTALLEGLVQKASPFRTCPLLQAAYLEIFNLFSSHGSHGLLTKAALSSLMPSDIPVAITDSFASASALLSLQRATNLVYETALAGDTHGLRSWLLSATRNDTDTACRMLESIPVAWGSSQSGKLRLELCTLYAQVCSLPTAPEVRAQALLNLGDLLESLLGGDQQPGQLPSVKELDQLWSHLQEGEINPTLSCAIIRTSGSLMAVLACLRSQGADIPNVDQRLRSWGAMVADCIAIDNDFDTRFAVAQALQSFFVGVRTHATWGAEYLPALLALYDSLVDDDDEVREAAALAAVSVIDRSAVPPAAADHLVAFLRAHFGALQEFKLHLVSRMTGQPPALTLSPPTTANLITASQQLRQAMDFDDALFAAEEQNLYIDEVRETLRWKLALQGLVADGLWGETEEASAQLKAWTHEGLGCLVQLAGEKADGPLGWTSDQHVFAVGARVLLCTAALVGAGECGEVKELVEKLKGVGKVARVHGSLSEMVSTL
ncbi:putative death-receptor fusion protein-domain-containing protein [Podospora appendiculata]|uniref:Death-receptor fusion protein-domain-containing protein n=1 Tax=Podospora appendiculata TaxID=314037 RepID=A0AAE1C899_9PEZI|nr:putative death-receptor fusion protein-domain-containing protein [Podospora appendiculata]